MIARTLAVHDPWPEGMRLSGSWMPRESASEKTTQLTPPAGIEPAHGFRKRFAESIWSAMLTPSAMTSRGPHPAPRPRAS